MNREPYFTPETIRQKSKVLLEALSAYRSRHTNIAFDPDRAALLVLDMQDYFLRETSHAFIPSAPAILPNIQMLVETFHAHARPIIFTRHVNTDADAGMMSHWWRNVIRADSPDSEITSALDTSTGSVIQKSQYDAFFKTELNALLLGREVGQVLVTGVMTHLCCETTARSAFVRGFEVFLCIDGMASYTEAQHRASLSNLSHGFGIPVEGNDIKIKYFV